MKFEVFGTPEKIGENKIASIATGAFFILIGGLFLLSQTGFTIMGQSPWILMALVPLFWIAVAIYQRYRQDRRISGAIVAMLAFSLVPFVFVGASLLGFDMGALWPLILIGIGAVVLLSGK